MQTKAIQKDISKKKFEDKETMHDMALDLSVINKKDHSAQSSPENAN
jgi:hypothetical protein